MSLASSVPHYEVVTSTLAGGLTLHVNTDRSAPVVAVNLWYGVGSRHESPGRTGFAHLFEHVMFQGSRHLGKAEHLELMQSLGAEVNGTTSFERTNYYETVPVQHLDLVLWAEADRMGGLLAALDQENLDNQREVVKNEKRQTYDNQPYGQHYLNLVEQVFPVGHPYHHLPIGSMADLDAATLEDVRSFFTTWYVPSNAHLAVVGDVDPEAVLASVERYFGGIDSGAAVPAAPVAGPLLTESSRRDLDDDVAMVKLTIAHPAAPSGTTEWDAWNALGWALGQGRGSSLYRRLVSELELVHPNANSGLMSMAGTQSLFISDFMLRDGVTVEQVLDAYDTLLDEVATDGFTEAELARGQAMSVASGLSSLSDVTQRADSINEEATLHGDADRINTSVAAALAVTGEQVRLAAKELAGPRGIVVTRPGGSR